MAKLRWILPFLALLTVAALTQLWILEESRTPRSVLESAREHLQVGDPDHGTVLHELGIALDMARSEGDVELERTVLLVRAELFRSRALLFPATRQYDATLALEDCRTALTLAEDEAALSLAAACALDARLPSEALQLSERLLVLAPEAADGARLVVVSRVALAEENLAPIIERLDLALASEHARRAIVAARRAAALPLLSPGRSAALERLRNAVPDPAFHSAAVTAIQIASEHLEAAGRAIVERLAIAPDGESVAALQELLLRAGALSETVDLGRLALTDPRLSEREGVVLRTVRALLDLQRREEAYELARDEVRAEEAAGFDSGELDSPTLLRWCLVLRELEMWAALNQAGTTFQRRPVTAEGHPELEGVGALLTLLARLRQGRSQGLDALEKRLPEGSDEAYPGMRFDTWLARANVGRQRGRDGEERLGLLSALRTVPDGAAREARRAEIGDVHLRFGLFRQRENAPKEAEEHLTQTLCMLPARRAEIEPEWERIGADAIVARGRSVSRVTADPGEREVAGRFPSMGPFEACLRARGLLGRGQPRAVAQLCREALSDHPGLPVALELLARAELARGANGRAIAAELERIEAGFLQPGEHSLLAEIPRDSFRGEDLVRWALFEPTALPFGPFLDELERSGRRPLLLATLAPMQRTAPEASQLVDVARRLARVGAWKEATRVLAAIDPAAPVFAETLGTAVHAGLADELDLPTVLSRYDGVAVVANAELLDAIDTLLARGRAEDALAVLDLIELPVDLGPELLLRKAAAAAVLHRGRVTDEALDRAEPFLSAHDVELGRITRGSDDRDTAAVANAALRALASIEDPPALEHALLLALTGDARAASELLTGLDPEAGEARVAYARAVVTELLPTPADEVVASPFDPPGLDAPWRGFDARRTLALLAGLGSPRWCPWVLARLEELPDELSGTPAASLLAAEALLAVGELDAAEARLTPWLQEENALPSAWNLRERVAAARSPEALAEVRDARLVAGIPWRASAAELALATARVAEANERPEEARAVLERALELEGEDHDLRLALARSHVRHGDILGALATYGPLFASADPRADTVAPEVARLLEEAVREGSVPEALAWAQLEVLAAERPLEPAFARELARRTLAAEGAGLDWGVERAWDLLERFRRRTVPATLESLRVGEAGRWAELMHPFDPERAEELAFEELAARPQSTDLWALWARSLAAVGRRDDARVALEAVSRHVPAPEILEGLALLRADAEAQAALFERIEEIPTAHLAFGPELRLRIDLARLRAQGPDWTGARRDVLAAWEQRAELDLPRAELGRAIALALAETGSLAKARMVLRQALRGERDPLQRSVLEAALHLLPPQPGEQPGE